MNDSNEYSQFKTSRPRFLGADFRAIPDKFCIEIFQRIAKLPRISNIDSELEEKTEYQIHRDELDKIPVVVHEKSLSVHTHLKDASQQRLKLISIKAGLLGGLGLCLMGILTIESMSFVYQMIHLEKIEIFLRLGGIALLIGSLEWIASRLKQWKLEVYHASHAFHVHHHESALIRQNLWERKAAG